jgi:TonB-dependent starch-binding outer membrane protein SusC
MKKNSESAIPLSKLRLKKLLTIMKLALIIVFLSVLQVSGNIYSQTNVSLNVKEKPIREVLKSLEQQTEIRFFFSDDLLLMNDLIDIKAEKKNIIVVLDEIFLKSPLTYKTYENNLIVIVPREFVQQQKITGIVVDKNGEPLPGVNVVVTGTTLGTATGINGEYSIDIPAGTKSLTYSFIGMEPREIIIGSSTRIDVTLQESSIGLEEVVVIGYGTIKKRDVSTAISSVSSEKLKDKPVSNFAQAISGNLAGVSVTNSNAAPGGGSQIHIRGIGSINAATSPLFVVDGFPLKDAFDKYENPLNSINPADIESIEVLKDASSSAIYGTQASNGVIIITTKKGKSGKPTISISASSGMQNRINKVDVLNREDYLQYFEDARRMAYLVEDPNWGTNDPEALVWQWTDSPETRIDNWEKYSQHSTAMKDPASLHYRWITTTDSIAQSPYDTDWQDATVRTGRVNDFQVSATGGTENFSYIISGGYFDQLGIIPTTGYKRYSLRTKLNARINKRLEVGLNLAPSFEDLDVLNTTLSDGTGAQPHLTNPLITPIIACPLLPVFNPDGSPYFIGAKINDFTNWNLTATINPYHVFLKSDNRKTAKNLATVFADIKITDKLTFRTEFHNEIRQWERYAYSPRNAATRNTPTDRTQGTNEITSRFYWNLQNILTYQNTFGKHNITGMAGYSVEEARYRSAYINKYDFPSDDINTMNQAITILNTQDDARTRQSSEALIGSMGRVMYNYGGRYYFTASIRRDGSSKFGTEHQWGWFPSVSLAWRISDESFFEPFKKYINDWKIRGGWGKTGNSGIGNYNAISTLGALNYVLGSTSKTSAAYEANKVANPSLGWETNTDWSIATDLQLLNDRIDLSVDYFYRLTDDLLYGKPLPVITGFDSYLTNIAKMRNRGFEWVVTSRNLTGSLRWTTNFNLYYFRNRVLDITSPLNDNNSYISENRPLSCLWGPVDLGAFDDWEDVKTHPIFGATTALWRSRSNPGTPKIADVNGDGILDASDYTVIGTPFPDFTWGMTNNFEYRNFDLTVQMNGTMGGDINMVNYGTTAQGNGQTNVTYFYYNNYWKPDRTDGSYACPTRKSYDKSDVTGALIFKGSFTSIQFITLGYTLPKNVIQKLNAGNARIFMNVQNAWLFTKFPGYNPEINSNGDDPTSQGLDRGAYPLSRTISLGINLTL